MVSIIIPARNEPFLQKTINGLLENAVGNIEIIAGLDGYWPQPAIQNHKHVHLLHTAESIGMRAMINAMVDLSKGEYILKTDAHCIFDKGYDEKLVADCKENWVVIPRQYSLDDDNWCRNMNKPYVDYWYFSAPGGIEEGGKPEGLHGVRWRDRKITPELENEMISDQMSFQGSCWFMTKNHFHNMELMDIDGYGDFANEAGEIGPKTWFSGGRVVVNKKTWYAHLHKGKKHGRGYPLSKNSVIRSGVYCRNFFMDCKWKKAIYDAKWLVDRFGGNEVPTWKNFDWTKDWTLK